MIFSFDDPKTRELFDCICVMVVDGFADMKYFDARDVRRASSKLRRAGLVGGSHDYDMALTHYNQTLEAYAAARLPEGYQASHDFWGAKCFKRPEDSTQDKQLPFYGDSTARYKIFDSAEAMIQYTDDLLGQLGRS